jgi:hypothetical protein
LRRPHTPLSAQLARNCFIQLRIAHTRGAHATRAQHAPRYLAELLQPLAATTAIEGEAGVRSQREAHAHAARKNPLM